MPASASAGAAAQLGDQRPGGDDPSRGLDTERRGGGLDLACAEVDFAEAERLDQRPQLALAQLRIALAVAGELDSAAAAQRRVDGFLEGERVAGHSRFICDASLVIARATSSRCTSLVPEAIVAERA